MSTISKTFDLVSLEVDAAAEAAVDDIVNRMGQAVLEACNAGKLARVTWTITVEPVAKPAQDGAT